MRRFHFLILGTFALGACAGTGAEYRPIVDGPRGPAFSLDLSECQDVARQRSYANADVKSDAAAGAAVGGLLTGLVVGLEEGDVGAGIAGAVIGAAIGGATAGGERAWETQGERKNIVVACMQGIGVDAVLGALRELLAGSGASTRAHAAGPTARP